jgi:hypothetical protein
MAQFLALSVAALLIWALICQIVGELFESTKRGK